MDDEIQAPDVWVVTSCAEYDAEIAFFLDRELAEHYARRINTAFFNGAAKVSQATFLHKHDVPTDENIWFCVSHNMQSGMTWTVEAHLEAIGPGPDHLRLEYDRKNRVRTQAWVMADDRKKALERGREIILDHLKNMAPPEPPDAPAPNLLLNDYVHEAQNVNHVLDGLMATVDRMRQERARALEDQLIRPPAPPRPIEGTAARHDGGVRNVVEVNWRDPTWMELARRRNIDLGDNAEE